MQAEATLSSRDIEDAITRALTCLRSNFRTTDTGGGWYHYLDDQRPGVTASAVGLYCFHLAGSQFERTQESLRFLLSQQVRQEGPQHGGWPVRTTNGVPVVEATAWVLCAMSATHVRSAICYQALFDGIAWLERNQNTDFGWGSYKGRPSRVFTTSLAMLALSESGGNSETVTNAQKWLNDAQSPSAPAWGPMPGAEPTVLHTAIALMAQLALQSSLPASAFKQTTDWLLERLSPLTLVERATTAEEYDVPYQHGSTQDVFQNSLPHFATPVAILALLWSGCDPLKSSIFAAAKNMITAQETDNPTRMGTWELPRSPERPSIWAVWPFVAALTSIQRAVFPSTDRCQVVETNATLLYPGCAIVQTAESPGHLTRRLLFRNALLDWVRRHKLTVAIWAIVAATVGIGIGLWDSGELNYQTLLLAMVVPALLLLFQILWDRRGRGTGTLG